MTLYSTDSKEIRKFGLIALVFFGCLCGLGLWMKKPIPAYLFGLLSLFGLGFVLLPAPLRPIYDVWLKIAHFIAIIVTALILAIAYYLVITPAAFIKRLFGGRPLPLRPDYDASSYWITRTEPAQPRERFIKRY